MRQKMTKEHKIMAYVLYNEFNYTMTQIAHLMDVTQPTISTSIKKITNQMSINDLSAEIEIARETAIKLGHRKPKIFVNK